MKKDNIAIIGLGYWGTIVTNTLIGMGKFNKIYIYDSDFEKIRIIKKKFNNKVIKIDINEIKKNRKIKNIFLATPPKQNFYLLKSLIKAKKKYSYRKTRNDTYQTF